MAKDVIMREIGRKERATWLSLWELNGFLSDFGDVEKGLLSPAYYSDGAR